MYLEYPSSFEILPLVNRKVPCQTVKSIYHFPRLHVTWSIQAHNLLFL